jgi:CrcB protein
MRRQPRPTPLDPDLDPDVAPDPEPGRPPLRPLGVLGAVAAGGVIGAVPRYELSQALRSGPGAFPLATFVTNVSGSLLLGALLTLIVERWPPTGYLRPFAATGIIGAYTTWSTFMVDADLLIKDGHVAMATGYVAASLSSGLAAAYAGRALVRGRPPRLRHRPDVLARAGEE